MGSVLSNFNSPELRHYAKRARTFALDKRSSILRKTARQISNGVELSRKEETVEALKRIANIPKLDKTCIRQGCKSCGKLVDLLGEEKEIDNWEVGLELYRWQKNCKDKWKENGGQGIIKVVTGAGKTILALALVEELNKRYSGENFKTVVVVPTTALLDQWFEEIKDVLNVPEEEIGTFYGGNKDEITKHRIMLYVINSARKYLPKHLEDIEDDVFLIADECHRAGSPKNSKIFNSSFDYSLGLSATPKRRIDYGFENKLKENLGEIIFTYSYTDAREDGIIPPYELIRVASPLTRKEREAYNKYSEKLKRISGALIKQYPKLEEAEGNEFFKELGEIKKKHKDKLVEKYTILANQRKAIVHESKSKISCLKYLITNKIDPKARVLIFHERTEIADQINEYLKEHQLGSTVYHTGIPSSERRKNLREYKEGKKSILVACRALDEGLDVPETSVGIIAAATSSVRQRIQRIGRILRKAPGKDHSEIYTIYIKGIEDRIFNKEDMQKLETSARNVKKIELGFPDS